MKYKIILIPRYAVGDKLKYVYEIWNGDKERVCEVNLNSFPTSKESAREEAVKFVEGRPDYTRHEVEELKDPYPN